MTPSPQPRHRARRLRKRPRGLVLIEVTMGLVLFGLIAGSTSSHSDSSAREVADQAGTSTRLLDFLFFTNFETEDPGLYQAPAGCVGKYYSEWIGKYDCNTVVFTTDDHVDGPMHTNDAANVQGAASFGREGVSPPDIVEIDGGTYPEDPGEKCTGKPIFHTATGCYTKGEKIPMPESAAELQGLAEREDEPTGETRLELDGAANTIGVINFGSAGKESVKTISWPRNGLIYVKSGSCDWPTANSTEAYNTDGPTEAANEKGCGNVYVRGTYSQPLTIAAEDDVIVDGNVYPTSVAGNLGAAPSDPATLGLVAGNYVRVYHPVGTASADTPDGCSASNLSETEDPNKWGSQPNIWIYAAILATDHSFLVDNWGCGASLGTLHVYGAVAQNYRGVIGEFDGAGLASGYTKDYLYDSRLAVDTPPYFLAREKSECPLAEAAVMLIGAGGVRRTTFTVRVPALGINEVTFYLDGRALRTLGAAQAKDGFYAVRINPRNLSYGRQTLSVRTHMEDASCAPIARTSVFVHPRAPQVIPRFTG